ncbi:hypothetical protein [Salarchaeum sp. JOR-1]|uniref:hypothetical protein n=1 Tax=Salarchaeum sp. JOR-1 TaxID=2599399 RepID=UPI0011983711|nr:hypothetical protein [Salarchaeum sp. JOR-1]QDX40277.1 hypothetical protein FQU85_04955 [Salarchaeum sp. JOR-1]
MRVYNPRGAKPIETDESSGESAATDTDTLADLGDVLADLEALTGDVKATSEEWNRLGTDGRADILKLRLRMIRDRIETAQAQGVNEHADAYFH